MAELCATLKKRHETEEEFIKRRLKELSSTETLDRMKTSFEDAVKGNPWHIKLQESLQKATYSSNPNDIKSYTEIFQEIGGEEATHLNTGLEGNDSTSCHNFREVVAQVVQTNTVMPHSNLKEKVFNDWDEITMQQFK